MYPSDGLQTSDYHYDGNKMTSALGIPQAYELNNTGNRYNVLVRDLEFDNGIVLAVHGVSKSRRHVRRRIAVAKAHYS